MSSWKGMFIGSCVGSLWGGFIGSILGAIIGHQVEKRWFGAKSAASSAGVDDADVAGYAEYRLLGASIADDNETLKRKYRDLAKKNHPDLLRSQGLSEAMLAKATERMERINAAWAKIKEARGI